MSKTLDLSLVLACYNEGDVFLGNIDLIFKVLRRSQLRFEVIFVDDVSKDDTRKKITRVLRKYPKESRAIYHEKNQGRGATVCDGFKEAKGKVVGYIDVDCEVSPIYISEAAEKVLDNECDVVLGHRIYLPSPKAFLRTFLSEGYKRLADSMLKTGKLDTESGYKFFDRKKILPLLKYADHPHWFWDTQIVVIAKRKKLRICEIPVLFLRREDKKSTVRLFTDTVDYLKNIWLFSRRLKRGLPKR